MQRKRRAKDLNDQRPTRKRNAGAVVNFLPCLSEKRKEKSREKRKTVTTVEKNFLPGL